MASPPGLSLRALAGVGLAVGLALLLAQPLSADFSTQRWRYFKAIGLPPGLSGESLVEVAPDPEVFVHGAPGLADLRILEASSQREVAFKLLVERGEQRRSSVALALRDLGHVPGQFTTFVADLRQEGVLHNELEIATPSQNFQRRVVVEGSADSKTWVTLNDRGQIFDFTLRERNFTARDTRVRYPTSTARYLRVRIINQGEAPLEVTGAVAYFLRELPPQETEVTAALVSWEENAPERKTLLLIDLGSRGLPTHRIAITTSQRNFYRQVRLEGSNDKAAWTWVQGSEVLYDYNTPLFVGSKHYLSYPESTFRYYRLTILNEDNPPLPITGARAHGYLRKLIFSADPASTYHLYYGNPEARTPSYELERIFPYLVTENLPQAHLGAHTPNPLFVGPPKPAPRPTPFTERYFWLLSSVFAVAGLLIGLFLASLLGQLRKVLPPPA